MEIQAIKNNLMDLNLSAEDTGTIDFVERVEPVDLRNHEGGSAHTVSKGNFHFVDRYSSQPAIDLNTYDCV